MATTAMTHHNVSRAHFAKIAKQLESAKARVAKVKEHMENTTEKVVRTVEVGSSALAVGVVQGRAGSVEIMGVPFELASGLALNLLGYFGIAGKHSDHLNNFGDGALAAYLVTVGRGVGTAMKAKASGSATKTSGLSPEEIASSAMSY